MGQACLAAASPRPTERPFCSIKSSSANVGGVALSGLFQKLEELGKEARLEEAGPLFDAAQREYERVLAELRGLSAEAE